MIAVSSVLRSITSKRTPRRLVKLTEWLRKRSSTLDTFTDNPWIIKAGKRVSSLTKEPFSFAKMPKLTRRKDLNMKMKRHQR